MPLLEHNLFNADLTRCRVLRSFQGDRVYEPDEVVDASGWRLAQRLIDLRYLAPAPALAEPTEAPRARKRAQDAE